MTATAYDDVETLVDDILDRLGHDITIGTPLGIGKPNHILNELVERAVDDPEIELEIWTALSLTKPAPSSDLERRLVGPLSDRLFGSYPDLTYDVLLQNGELPENIEVHEFYFQPGEYMGNPEAQQNYHSVNYTHALRAFLNAEPDLVLQLVGKGYIDGDLHYNLASNTDLTNELIDALVEKRESGEKDGMIIGEVNRNMPFMYGEAPVSAERVDAVLDDESYDFPLFGPPKEPVTAVEHAIGLRVSALVRDGGTLQIGIGSLGDAIAASLELRHQDNETYREIVDDLGVHEDSPTLVEEYGGLDTFEDGLYGATEMFVEGFLHLYESNVLTRQVFDDPHIQRLVNEGYADDSLHDNEGFDADALEFLVEERAIREHLDEQDVTYLREWGIFREDVEYDDGSLAVDGELFPADLSTAREEIVEHALGDTLDGGQVMHGAFFMGSKDFYSGLREMDETDRRDLSMDSVQFTNALYGQEQLKRLQRPDARFVNTGMKATLTGGVVSDGTEDGRVVSGVGGQFNFVNQAQELDGGRSILMIRSTRGQGEDAESNVVWNYGHLTIPRHLRDIVVTEYGVADLRGKSDAEVIAEMIQVADSRFQDDLATKAKAAGKLPQDWELPRQYRNNYPETLEEKLGPYQEAVLTRFPFGSNLTEEERGLARALQNMETSIENRDFSGFANLGNVRKSVQIPAEAKPYLKRMDLDRPSSLREQALRRAVVFALLDSDII